MYRRVFRRIGSEVALAEMPGFRRGTGPASHSAPSADEEAAAASALLLGDEEVMTVKRSAGDLWGGFGFDCVLFAADGNNSDVP